MLANERSNVVFTTPKWNVKGLNRCLSLYPNTTYLAFRAVCATPGRTGTARIPPRLLATGPTIIGSRGLQDCCCCAAVYSETVIRPGACVNTPREPPDGMATMVPAALVSAGLARNKFAFCIVCLVRSPLKSCVMNFAPTGLQPGQTVIPFLT